MAYCLQMEQDLYNVMLRPFSFEKLCWPTITEHPACRLSIFCLIGRFLCYLCGRPASWAVWPGRARPGSSAEINPPDLARSRVQPRPAWSACSRDTPPGRTHTSHSSWEKLFCLTGQTRYLQPYRPAGCRCLCLVADSNCRLWWEGGRAARVHHLITVIRQYPNTTHQQTRKKADNQPRPTLRGEEMFGRMTQCAWQARQAQQTRQARQALPTARPCRHSLPRCSVGSGGVGGSRNCTGRQPDPATHKTVALSSKGNS